MKTNYLILLAAFSFGVLSCNSDDVSVSENDQTQEVNKVNEVADTLVEKDQGLQVTIDSLPKPPLPEPVKPIPAPILPGVIDPGIIDPIPYPEPEPCIFPIEPPYELEIPVPDQPEKEEQEEIYDIPEVPAKFPGGDKAFFEFLKNTIEYPSMATDQGIQGVVYYSFVVEKDGSISNVKLLRGISKELDAEAKRVILAMPNWTSAMQRGVVCRSRVNIPLRFTFD